MRYIAIYSYSGFPLSWTVTGHAAWHCTVLKFYKVSAVYRGLILMYRSPCMEIYTFIYIYQLSTLSQVSSASWEVSAKCCSTIAIYMYIDFHYDVFPHHNLILNIQPVCTCPRNHVLNHATGRCECVQKQPVPVCTCPRNYVLNQATGRCDCVRVNHNCPVNHNWNRNTCQCLPIFCLECRAGAELENINGDCICP